MPAMQMSKDGVDRLEGGRVVVQAEQLGRPVERPRRARPPRGHGDLIA
jgi:hypothetical protein